MAAGSSKPTSPAAEGRGMSSPLVGTPASNSSSSTLTSWMPRTSSPTDDPGEVYVEKNASEPCRAGRTTPHRARPPSLCRSGSGRRSTVRRGGSRRPSPCASHSRDRRRPRTPSGHDGRPGSLPTCRHPRVHRHRAPGLRPRSAGRVRRQALPTAVRRRRESRQGVEADGASAAQRHPDLSRGRGPEERGAVRRDRRRLAAAVLLAEGRRVRIASSSTRGSPHRATRRRRTTSRSRRRCRSCPATTCRSAPT